MGTPPLYGTGVPFSLPQLPSLRLPCKQREWYMPFPVSSGTGGVANPSLPGKGPWRKEGRPSLEAFSIELSRDGLAFHTAKFQSPLQKLQCLFQPPLPISQSCRHPVL